MDNAISIILGLSWFLLLIVLFNRYDVHPEFMEACADSGRAKVECEFLFQQKGLF